MVSGDEHERRKGLRVSVQAELYFNVLGSPAEYTRGQGSIIKRLRAIDAIQVPPARTEAQVLLTRIDQKLSILVGLLAETSTPKTYSLNAVVVDISECGLAFAHTQTFPKGTVLEIGLQLPTGEESRIMDIAGKIVNAKSSPEPGGISKNIYGVEFIDITGKDQNDIVQWLFNHQREQIRRRREKESA
ncbi:MAG: PilZ domain-containing protein [Candidatus Adiutrix sp.]|jgi:hypothetical protein|nr:PilZ domain-containing protein [Candidatus Adiutrix sp.]